MAKNEPRNERERQRVNVINDAFVTLQQVIPTLQQENRTENRTKTKTSKLVILRNACSYINFLTKLLQDQEQKQKEVARLLHERTTELENYRRFASFHHGYQEGYIVNQTVNQTVNNTVNQTVNHGNYTTAPDTTDGSLEAFILSIEVSLFFYLQRKPTRFLGGLMLNFSAFF